MIRTLTYGAVVAMALAASSCARNQSHEGHVDHEPPTKQVELEKPAAPTPVVVEHDAAVPEPAPIEPSEIGGVKPQEKPKSVRRPKPAPHVEPEQPRPAAPAAPAPAAEPAGNDSHPHHHH